MKGRSSNRTRFRVLRATALTTAIAAFSIAVAKAEEAEFRAGRPDRNRRTGFKSRCFGTDTI